MNVGLQDIILDIFVENLSQGICFVQNFSHSSQKLSKDPEKQQRYEKYYRRALEQGPEVKTQTDTSKEVDGTSAAVISLFPSFGSYKQPPSNLIFLIDRSGSMSGKKMDDAKATLRLFLRSLPTPAETEGGGEGEGSSEILFNIYSFGTSYESIFPKSVPYNASNFQRADKAILSFSANLGGTELMPVLTNISKNSLSDDHFNQIIIVTDGQVSNSKPVISFIENQTKTLNQTHHNGQSLRYFSIGIGSDVDVSLVESISKSGDGRCEIVTDTEQKLQAIVSRFLKIALNPSFNDIKLEWPKEITETAPFGIRQIRLNSDELIHQERFFLYVLWLTSSHSSFPQSSSKPFIVRLTASSKYHDTFSFDVPIDMSRSFSSMEQAHSTQKDSSNSTPSLIHILAGRTLIDALYKESPGTKFLSEIKALSFRFSILSPFTSFIVSPDSVSTEPTTSSLELFSVSTLRDIRQSQKRKEQRRDYSDVSCFDTEFTCDSSVGYCLDDDDDDERFAGFTYNPNSFEGFTYVAPSSPPSSPSSSISTASVSSTSSSASTITTPKKSSSSSSSSSSSASSSSSSSSLASVSPPKIDFSTLVSLQEFDGSWQWNENLQKVLALNSSSGEVIIKQIEKILTERQLSSKIIGTMVVICVLLKYFADRKSEFDLLVKKAQKWVEANRNKTESDDGYWFQTVKTELSNLLP